MRDIFGVQLGSQDLISEMSSSTSYFLEFISKVRCCSIYMPMMCTQPDNFHVYVIVPNANVVVHEILFGAMRPIVPSEKNSSH